ncbi:MAG: hypothetical protein KTR16_10105 [Acidiferrobacterales bacterium]|nr:hypothetical protein [Acidiferrobacterales bacterium]
MKKLVIFFIVLAAAVFGAKFGLEKYYESKLDNLFSQASIVANIDYGNVKIGTDGSISINNLLIRPNAVNTVVSIDSISLFSSDILLPVNLASFLKRNQIPEELGVRIDNMEYDPSFYETNVATQQACRYIETTMLASNMGINRMNTDIEMSFTTNAENTTVNLSSIDQTAAMKSKIIFDGNLLNSARSGTATQPLDEITINYKLDEQIASQLISNCADKLAINSDEFLNSVVGSPQYLRLAGVDFGPAANQAMTKFIQGGRWLSIRSKPSSSINSLNDLKFFQAKDITRLLGLRISVDSNEVELEFADLETNNAPQVASAEETTTLESKTYLSAAEQQLLALDQAELSEEQQRIKQKLEDDAASQASRYSYKSTPLGSLANYINYSVIVDRINDKKQMNGELIAINDDGFVIVTGQYGGKAEFTILNQDVEDIRVYR